jgi:transcriptional regulator with XRE-family HTH domain
MSTAEPLPALDPTLPRIAAIAAARGMDERALAAATGVSRATATRWLRGKSAPALSTAVRLAEALRVPVHALAPTPAQAAREGLSSLSANTYARSTWSVSKVHDYLRCPAYFYFRHIAEVPEPPRPDPALGHAVHRGIEVGYTGTLPDGRPAEPRQAMLDDLEANLPDTPAEIAGAEGDGDEAAAQTFESLAEEAEALLGLYRREVAGKITVRAAEQRAEVEIAGVAFTVVSDVVTADGFVRDTKVSKRRPAETDIAMDLQATAESLAYRRLYGEPEQGIIFDYLLRHKRGPAHIEMPTTRTERDHTRLARIVEGVASAVEREAFFPNPDTRFGCASCPFFDVCRQTF